MKIKKYSIPIIVVAMLLVVGVTVGFATSNAKVSDKPDSQDNAGVLTVTSSHDIDVTGNIDKVSNLEDNNSQINGNNNSMSKNNPANTNKEWVWPVEGCNPVVTTRFGKRYHPISGDYEYSDHISISGDGVEGADVYAALTGTVSETSFDEEQGNYIVISHDNGIETIYRHLGKLQVFAGNTVAAGDTIGTVGSTGKVTGTCLSFCVYMDGSAVNPLNYLQIKF